VDPDQEKYSSEDNKSEQEEEKKAL
jgi:hypothetical protein